MKSLVIYFSRNGENYMENGLENIEVGNTEILAKRIADLTNSDIFKVEVVKEYPFDYHECCDVAKYELENNIFPEVKNKLESIDEYDTIYIGGPVWWGHLPKALINVIKDLDFTGKIIKPFCTHEGSGLGSIVEDIKNYCSYAQIKDGLVVRGSKVNESNIKIKKWCE